MLESDDAGYRIAAEIAPVAGDHLVPKNGPSAFFGTPLASIFIHAHVDTILLCGGVPVFADIDPATFNLSVAAAEAAITPRTRAIMPRFRNMTRAVCGIGADFGPLRSPGAVLATLELDGAPGGDVPRILEANAGAGRLRFAIPDAKTTRVPNPEAKMRGAPDRLPAPFVLLEGHDEAALRVAAEELAQALDAPKPARVFRLILARSA